MRAFSIGVRYCTVRLGSLKNFCERPAEEVVVLLDVVNRFLMRTFPKDRLHPENNISSNIVGEWGDIIRLRRIEHQLSRNPIPPERAERVFQGGGRVLTLLVGFDVPERTQYVLNELSRAKAKISTLPRCMELGVKGLPKVDLWLRTGDRSSGERAIMNHDSCYFATPTYWPDMTMDLFEDYLLSAERRFEERNA